MKVFFDMVGCRLNQAEIELLAGQFKSAGHEVISSADGADLVVVNTCSVTAAAASDSRQKARQASQAGAKQILLTGCWATLEPDQAKSLPGVSDVVSNLQKMDIPLKILGGNLEEYEKEPITRSPVPGAHKRTRAFIKAQDGCDNYCTFCVTRLARGEGRSVPKKEIFHEIKSAESSGVREVVLSGVHLGSWGNDQPGSETITDLITFLLAESKVERIRLSSIEPWDLDERFFGLWQNPRLCRHLHLPLQSGSASVLKRMARHTTPSEFFDLVKLARKLIPGVSITTDLIVGFPGETEGEFLESLEFVNAMNFNGGHVFRYSPREGTSAVRLPGRVHGIIAKERAKRMSDVLKSSEVKHLSKMIGQDIDVLWEGSGRPSGSGWLLHGLSDQYIKVESRSTVNRWNLIDRVKIEGLKGNGLTGRIDNHE